MLLFYHSITEFVFHNYFREAGSTHCLAEVIAEVSIHRPSGHNCRCMSRISFAIKSLSDCNAHEQTIICRQLFADHIVGSLHQMILCSFLYKILFYTFHSLYQLFYATITYQLW